MNQKVQTCYLCKEEKTIDSFILRKDGIRYKMCSSCNNKVQEKRTRNGKKKLEHTETHRTCYKCMRLLEKSDFTRRATGSYYSACKECNKYEFSHLRRARVKKAEGNFTAEEFHKLLANFEACPMCQRKWDDIPLTKGKKVPWTADHIVPITPLKEGDLPGANDISNIQPLCYSCNSKKGNRTV